ncbi:hypothetical protein AAFF_G00275080 [Aldrovandia affinis]|uniref:Uncharacterized protein n=1 Tax=Aldrovandia affinis TaxID=143900 RepID=A0AAD7WSD2_9TELE|nr:hypothetical protein AAFF_G00275080 [Aldrovandia affinis]
MLTCYDMHTNYTVAQPRGPLKEASLSLRKTATLSLPSSRPRQARSASSLQRLPRHRKATDGEERRSPKTPLSSGTISFFNSVDRSTETRGPVRVLNDEKAVYHREVETFI